MNSKHPKIVAVKSTQQMLQLQSRRIAELHSRALDSSWRRSLSNNQAQA